MKSNWLRVLAFAGLLTALSVTPVLAQVGRNQGLVNPNLASKADMVGLPGMSEARVDAVIAGRPYLDMLAFDRVVSELSDAQKEALYRRLWVPLNLNTATREEILLVPGAGARMAREFDEYRPYVAIAQFRREIGKYVDDTELARLEQYVFVPIDLNTASDEAILSIPGVGDRMLHEFKEYRPYTNMAQFRREIGKYVDDGEVERLARYVTIR